MMGFIDQATGFLKIILMTSGTVIVSLFLAFWFMPMYYLIRKLKSRESFCRYDVIGVIARPLFYWNYSARTLSSNIHIIGSRQL